jgi:chromosome partitioning protein
MILTIGGIKGGVGKSMIAVNLVVIRSSKGKRVLLVDGDEQGTAGDWADQRAELGAHTPWTTVRLKANAVRTEVKKLSINYDDVIIDCGGRDTASLRAALTISDIFLIPMRPSSFDIWTVSQVSRLVQEARALNEQLLAYTFINCAGARGSDNDDAKTILSKVEGLELLSITIGLRKSFSNATGEGLGIIETKTDPKAIKEITTLHDSLYEEVFLKGSKSSQNDVIQTSK